MDNQDQVGQRGWDLGTQMAPLAKPVMDTVNGISPIIEYLLQMLGQQQKPQPAPATTSQQTGTYSGPVATPDMKQQMMGR